MQVYQRIKIEILFLIVHIQCKVIDRLGEVQLARYTGVFIGQNKAPVYNVKILLPGRT